ncbi:MAG: polysaccharide (de)acetylase [Mariniphaga sp.]|nr:polysaccharide (de)acetylase [Mariniphaga sp.]
MTKKEILIKNLSNIPGWRTKRKIVVIESDDWGAIRMSSKQNLDQLSKQGVKPCSDDEARYLQNDSLASENDLIGLFEVLTSAKDRQNRNAVFNAVAVVANPDFDKIRENGFQKYEYEPFNETLKRYPEHGNSFALWQEGIANQLFIPQFHGREHLNVTSWMKALQVGDKDTLAAFDLRVYGITPRNPINSISYQAAFDFVDIKELEYQKSVLTEGLILFEKLFGYKATFFVPTNGPFNNQLEETTAKMGIKYMGAAKIQAEPIGNGQFKKHFHYLGQQNKFGQRYLTRNCFFEPSSNLKSDWIDACMNDISIAFRWHKPAVISSHRVNYIGCINPANRDNGLSKLKELLYQIVKKWPDVEFMTSAELGDLTVRNTK